MLVTAGATSGLLTTSPAPAAGADDFEITLPAQVANVSDIAVGPNGDVILGGTTMDADFPTTPDAVDRTCGARLGCHSDREDGFVMILSGDGTMRYSTFVGADGEEHGVFVAFAADGSVWAVLGNTRFYEYERGSGLCNGRQPVLMGIMPGSSSVSGLTCIGGPAADGVVTDLAVARDGSVWVVGSGQGMQTVNAWQPVSGGSLDLFIARYAAGRQEPLLLTYVGGSGDESAGSLALTGDGDVVVSGTTSSPDFPVVRPIELPSPGTAGSGGGPSDAVLLRLDATGRWLEYSTTIGGSSFEVGHGVAVDADGNVYLAGQTRSPDFPVSVGTAKTRSLGSEIDGFLVSLDTVGRLRFSSVFGGASTDIAEFVVASRRGPLLVFGYTNSPDFAVVPGIPMTPAFGRPLVVRGDTGGATVQCLLEGPLLPTWHWTAGVVTQHAGHLYISGDVGRWIPGTNTREYAGQYLKKWRTGFEPDENDGPPGQTRRR
jgi:hypothetical protein